MLTSISPPPGLDSDDTTFSAKGRWADCNNVRFWNGSPQIVGEAGAVIPFSFGGGTPATNGGQIYPFSRDGVTNIALGATDFIHSYLYISVSDAGWIDRSPAGLAGEVRFWSFGTWGSTLLFNPSGDTLFEQSGTSSATKISAAPDQISCILVTPQRQVLALGCNEEISGTFNGLCIRGCDLEDYHDWTTSATNNAFEHILEGGGSIVAAAQVGEVIAVLTDNALYIGQFIGDPGQTYRFDKVADNCGVIGPKAFAVTGQTLYWLSSDLRVRAWEPGAQPAVVPCPIFRYFSRDIIAFDNTHLCHLSKFGEIWINYPSSANNGQIGYIAFSVGDGTWFKGNMALASMADSELLFTVGGSSYSSTCYAMTGDGLLALDCKASVTAVLPASWHLQSADQYLDDSQRRMMIRGVHPDFKGLDAATNDGPVALTLYCRDRPQSNAASKGPYMLAAGVTKKDFRASGKIIAFRLGWDFANVNRELRIGKLLFDIVPLGER